MRCGHNRRGYDTHEITFAKNANGLPLFDKLLGFQVLGTLFMTGKFPQVLIANHKNRCMSCNAIIYTTPCSCSRVSSFASRNGQRSSEYKSLTEKFAILIAGPIEPVSIARNSDWLRDANEPLLNG